MAINAPEGTRDLLPDEALFWNQFKQAAAEVFGTYGYLPIETPIMEQTELFVRGIGEATDVVSKEMFTAISGENLRRWVEEGKAPKAKSRLSLRPEGTAGVVRAVVQHDLVPQGAAPAKLKHADELCDTCMTRAEMNPLRAFDCKNPQCAAIMADAPKITDHLCDECREHYDAVKTLLDGAGVVYEEDYKLVRGLDYYTRTVFEVQVDNGMGAQNAIGGGGRYDKLAEEVGGRPTPGLGFALGFERCVLALEAAGVEFPRAQRCDLFVACVDDSVRARAFALVQECRDAGFTTEMDHQKRSLKSQFKLADKLGAARVAVLGPDELDAGEVTLRDMATHTEAKVRLEEVVGELGRAIL